MQCSAVLLSQQTRHLHAVDEMPELKHLKESMTDEDWEELQQIAEDDRGKLLTVHDDAM